MIKVSDFYKNKFGCKVYKICLDAGCTCPNRDGTKGTGGCIFCSVNGSGDFIPEKNLEIGQQILEAEEKVLAKNRNGKFLAYFQNFTNTYGDPEKLFNLWIKAAETENITGVAIGTRPDCLSKEIIEKIKKLSEITFVQLELGLQTSNEKTGELINRKYSDADYENAVKTLKKECPEVHVVTHLIFGLPCETEKDMMDSVDFTVKCGTDGLKISVLYVLKDTELFYMYENGEFKTLEMKEYFNLLEKALKRIPEKMVIHRLTGDGPKKLTVAPEWTFNKKMVLNELNRRVEKLKDEN